MSQATMTDDQIRLTRWAANRHPIASMEIEDWVQETLLRVLQKIHLYDATKAKFATWVTCVVARMRIEYIYRSQALKRCRPTFSIYEDETDHYCGDLLPEEFAIKEEMRGKVHEAIELLPKDQADLVRMKLSGIPLRRLQSTSGYSTTSNRLRSGLNFIRQYIGERI
jgi:RNA polymerase sigma factor (sigma-70 family)